MTPYPHQIKAAEVLLPIFRQNALVYVAYEERVGKTLTIMLMLEQTTIRSALVLTKKAAIEGWQETIHSYASPVEYTITNYEQSHKCDPDHYDAIILDEAHHALASYPKPSQTWKKVKWLCRNKPIVFASATPYPETLAQIFHQLALSDWSPFNMFKTFYTWHREYGIPHEIWLGGRRVQQYNKVQESRVLSQISHLFHTLTRAEVGFEFEPQDKIHYVELTERTLEWYHELETTNLTLLENRTVVAETEGAKMQKLAQLVGGTMIDTGDGFQLPNREKIDYILSHFGDREDVAIMYNYKQEEIKLKEAFRQALILQADKYAEGVDLHHVKHLLIYSMSFRTSKYIQRRARQANMKRKEEIVIHYILSGKIDNKIYEAVALKKQNFTARLYR